MQSLANALNEPALRVLGINASRPSDHAELVLIRQRVDWLACLPFTEHHLRDSFAERMHLAFRDPRAHVLPLSILR